MTKKDVIKAYLEAYPSLRVNNGKKLAIKVWKDQIEREGIETLEDFLDKYENTDLVWSEQTMTSTVRSLKKEYPHLKADEAVEQRNLNLHNTVYVNEYGQTPR